MSKDIILHNEPLLGVRVDRVMVRVPPGGRLSFWEIETEPDGRLGNVRNLLTQLTAMRVPPEEMARVLGGAREISFGSFMRCYGDTLVEEDTPPFREVVEDYRRRHGALSLKQIG